MVSEHEPPVRVRRSHEFATTRWSVIASAGDCSSGEARCALEQLCATYWMPLYSYVRRRVPEVAQAQDLTQAFFAELLEKNSLAAATPRRGRFRGYLLGAFKHFLSREWEKKRARKRGGGRTILPLDFAAADSRLAGEPSAGLTAEQIYDRQWASALLSEIIQRLQAEYDETGRAAQFDELKPFLIGEHAGTNYRDVAARLGMSEPAARQAASRLRKRYRELLREEIAQTVNGPEEIEDEIRNLFAMLQLQ